MGRLFEPKEKKPIIKQIGAPLVGSLYYLVVLGLIGLIGLAIWASVNAPATATPNDPSFVSNQTAIFAVILAGLTLTLASSIIIPKVLLKFEVESQLSELKKEFRQEFKKEVLPKFLTQNEVTDAHLSRMIGYLILNLSSQTKNKSEYLYQLTWAVGWALRSYKRYIGASEGELITGEDISLKNYNDLIVINHKTMEDATDKIFAEARECETIQDLQEVILSTKNGEEINNRNRSLFFRTIKETVDIDYEVNYLQNQKTTKSKITGEAERQIKRWLKSVSPVTSLLIALVHFDISLSLKNEQEAMEILEEEIRKRSNFKNEPEFRDCLLNSLTDRKNEVGIQIDEGKIRNIGQILTL